jgi:hypothetical protein
VVTGAAILATSFAVGVSGAGTPATPSSVPTGTAAVVRTTITSRQQVNGTLGYASPVTITAPSGATPQQIDQARAAYDAAEVQVRNARGIDDVSASVLSAQTALDHLVATYASAKSNAMSVMEGVLVDAQTFRRGIDTTYSQLDAALIEQPQSGSDFRSALNALEAGLTPITNARAASQTLLLPALADYQRARNPLGVAIAQFDSAFAADADTSAAAASFTTALATHDLSVSRLNGAIDSINGATVQMATAVTSAQGFLNGANARYNPVYDVLRADLATLLTTVSAEQQLAASIRLKVTQATSSLATLRDAIAGGLRTAREGVATAHRQAAQSGSQQQATMRTAQEQLASASTALEAVRASEALGPGTFTWLPPPGATILRGEPLYAVDGVPVPLLIGTTPMFRRIAIGTSGADVGELEENLVAMGFGARMDGTFDQADADALRSWQRSIGTPESGDLIPGAAVFTTAPVRVSAVRGAVGSAYAPGGLVLDVSDTEHVVTVALDATLQSSVKAGDSVTINLPGHAQAVTGKVNLISPVAQAASQSNQQQGQLRATVTVIIALQDPNAGGALDQAPVRVSIVDQVRVNVLAVPVVSLIARSDATFVVRVVRGTQREDVPVVPGVFGDSGLVEVTGAGLNAGDQVEVPKPL